MVASCGVARGTRWGSFDVPQKGDERALYVRVEGPLLQPAGPSMEFIHILCDSIVAFCYVIFPYATAFYAILVVTVMCHDW